MSYCTEGLPGVAESIINSGIFPHGFCDFAIGFAQNDMREENMLRKIKMHQVGLEKGKFEIILSGKSFSKILRLNEIFVIH